ncbi:MAG: O-acetyl-ADP-ribose deacetylase [Deltaproteobacteria bacterium]|nr:O-acetyl-ADP-ribose deacetylase [Deltaproteobacteria bacterium]
MLENILVVHGDITEVEAEVVVNAANTSLLGGGGVDGAIHRAAGPGLLEECRTLGGANTGEAKITGAYDLPARWVVHTPGPVWQGGHAGEEELLAKSYRNSFLRAAEVGARSIALPAISTGIYRFPKVRATRIAVREARAALAQRPELRVVFVCFSETDARLYREALGSLRPTE